MELEEVFVSPLTTATTCYCIGNHFDSLDSSESEFESASRVLRFANENHVVGIVTTGDRIEMENFDGVSRDNSSVICVGYSQAYLRPQTGVPVQTLAMVDVACVAEQHHIEANPMILHPPLHSPIDSKDDSASVSSTTQSVQENSVVSVNRVNAHRPSLSSSNHQTGGSSSSSVHRRNRSDGSAIALSSQSDPTKPVLQVPKGRVVLQVPSSEEPTQVQDYVAFVNFRPLSPCIIRWEAPNSSQRHHKSSIQEDQSPAWAVLVGSADDSQLRLYLPDPASRRLVCSRDDSLPKEHFGVETPVLGLAYHCNDDRQVVAVACQDGTVQLIMWSGIRIGKTGWSFEKISSHRVIVDGPLISLQFQNRERNLRCLVGSLCGYVCQLVLRPDSGAPGHLKWEGPTMIADGLWNHDLDAEDSVLAVHAFGDCVALGTLGGRCMIYQESAVYENERFYLLWECRLPYSIHGLSTFESSSSWELIVVTRRSVHVFRNNEKGVPRNAAGRYSSILAKERLEQLLNEMKPQLNVTQMAQHPEETIAGNSKAKVWDDEEAKNDAELPMKASSNEE